jgi:hypothetical protein
MSGGYTGIEKLESDSTNVVMPNMFELMHRMSFPVGSGAPSTPMICEDNFSYQTNAPRGEGFISARNLYH